MDSCIQSRSLSSSLASTSGRAICHSSLQACRRKKIVNLCLAASPDSRQQQILNVSKSAPIPPLDANPGEPSIQRRTWLLAGLASAACSQSHASQASDPPAPSDLKAFRPESQAVSRNTPSTSAERPDYTGPGDKTFCTTIDDTTTPLSFSSAATGYTYKQDIPLEMQNVLKNERQASFLSIFYLIIWCHLTILSSASLIFEFALDRLSSATVWMAGPLQPVRLPRLEHVCSRCFPDCVGAACLLRLDIFYPRGGSSIGAY